MYSYARVFSLEVLSIMVSIIGVTAGTKVVNMLSLNYFLYKNINYKHFN